MCANSAASLPQGNKKLCPQCNTITSPGDLRRVYLWRNMATDWMLTLRLFSFCFQFPLALSVFFFLRCFSFLFCFGFWSPWRPWRFPLVYPDVRDKLLSFNELQRGWPMNQAAGQTLLGSILRHSSPLWMPALNKERAALLWWSVVEHLVLPAPPSSMPSLHPFISRCLPLCRSPSLLRLHPDGGEVSAPCSCCDVLSLPAPRHHRLTTEQLRRGGELRGERRQKKKRNINFWALKPNGRLLTSCGTLHLCLCWVTASLHFFFCGVLVKSTKIQWICASTCKIVYVCLQCCE